MQKSRKLSILKRGHIDMRNDLKIAIFVSSGENERYLKEVVSAAASRMSGASVRMKRIHSLPSFFTHKYEVFLPN